jgi:hypothetical protein
MITRTLTTAAIALGLALAPVVSFAAAPRAAGQLPQFESVHKVEGTQKKPTKKAPPKKTTAKKKSAKPAA